MRRLIALAIAVAALPWGQAGRAAPEIDLIAPVDGPIVRHFEPPPTPFTAGHRGIDIAAPEGSIVVAAAGGVVAFAGQVGGDLFVSIDHPEGLRTTYSFLSRILVAKGQTVVQGQPVAASGPGHVESPEPVLHFGLREGGTYLDPEAALLASMRRNLWRVVGLAPLGPGSGP